VNADRPPLPGLPGEVERLAESRMRVAAAEAAVMLLGATPFGGDPELVEGECGHAMPGREWIHGWRVCRGCPQEPLISDEELGITS